MNAGNRAVRRYASLPGLVLATVVLLAALEAAWGADSPPWQRAGELLRSGDYRAARVEAERQLQSNGNDAVLLRIQGVCLMEEGDVDGAVGALRQALRADASSIACRYYLAQALACQGGLEEAIRTLRDIIAMAPESEYARLAKEVLPRLTDAGSTVAVVANPQRWNLYARGGAEYDDNVPARSRHSADPASTEAWRAVYSAYVEVRPLDQAVDRLPATLGVGYSYYGSSHERAFEDFDVSSHSAKVFLSHAGALLSKAAVLRAQGAYTDTQLGRDPYSRILGAEVTADVQWAGWTQTSIRYSLDDKRFKQDAAFPDYYSRDGTDQSAGIAEYVHLPGNRVTLGIEYAYRFNQTEGTQFEIRSHNVSGSLAASLPLALRLYGRVSYQQEDYVDFVPSPRRLDDVWTYYGSISRRLWTDRLNAEVGYTCTRSDSNLDFSEYDRTVVTMGLNVSL
jgi:tetratricopeptide (TPR) repeat protein